MIAVAEDVPRLRDGLGIPVPPGVAACVRRAGDPSDRGSRAALGADPRPVRRRVVARRYGLGRAVVEAACQALVGPGTLVAGSFVDLPGPMPVTNGRQFCHSPGPRPDQAAHAGPAPQGGRAGRAGRVRALPGRVAGRRVRRPEVPTLCCRRSSSSPATRCRPARWRRSILPAEVEGYTPAMLDELTTAGEVRWVGDGPIGESDGWVRWYVADQEPHPGSGRSPLHYRSQELLAALGGGGGVLLRRTCCLRGSASPTARPTSRRCGTRLGRSGDG